MPGNATRSARPSLPLQLPTVGDGDLVDLIARLHPRTAQEAIAAYLKNNYGHQFPASTDSDWLEEAADIIRLMGKVISRPRGRS